ncbi:class I SAM-dependent RNA methyltransferase [Haliea sp. E17]|uniref:class I SAM-dependent RNA methyltransferase n=1 Tax=Haliea sp. E17 TaxID=3401576 RepID=UPI003AB0B945
MKQRKPGHTSSAPGHTFEGSVRDIASDGRAVVPHPDGPVVFVPGLWLEERALIRVTGARGRAWQGEIVELLDASPARRPPPCRHHGFATPSDPAPACGACPWMFVNYPAQLACKQSRVEQAFERLGTAGCVAPIWATPETLGYRNRAQLKSDGKALGFVAAGSRRIAPVEDCPVLSAHNRQLLQQLRAQLPNPAWRPRRGGEWTTLDIDEEVQLESVSVNARRPFRQANDAQNQRMRDWLAALASDFAGQEVLELYCGTGNFTQVLSAAGARVLALEGDDAAVDMLQQRNLPGVSARRVNLFAENAFEQLSPSVGSFEALVLDPPRDGLKVTRGLLPKKSRLHTVAYISCDLATLVRDVAYFQQHGFDVVSVQPLDQFPHTPHIECLVHLSR